MIDRGGNAKVMDFGIARAVKEKSITGAGVIIGTPQYMSPEQVEGKEVDQRSDIYSLGIVLYEMLTDRVPFEGDTPLTVGVKQKTEKPKDPREFNERIPDDLSQLILKCLEKDRENRYRNAAELRTDLEKLEQGLPTTDRVIPKKKTLTSREITVQFNMKKLLFPLLAVFALIVIGLVIWSPWMPKETNFVVQDKPSLAVLYFENSTGDENMDKWERVLSNSIITDLSQSKYISVLSYDRILSILRKIDKLDSTDYATEDLKAVAVEGGVNYIITGILSKAGETFRIDYTLHDIQREGKSGSGRVEGQGETNIFPMVDELTLKVKKHFNLSEEQLEDDVDREIWRISTAKPEAYKYYIEAQQLDNLGNFTQMVPILEKAIEIDPEFAMAYRMLAAVTANLGDAEVGKTHLSKAYELRDRVPEIEKRLITADYLNGVERNYEEAIDAYQRLFELAPNHPIGHLNLATIYDTFGDTDKTIEHREISLLNLQRFYPLREWLGYNYAEKRMYEKARKLYQDYIDNVQDLGRIHARIAETYIFEGEYELALEEVDKALSLDPTSYTKSGIYHLQGYFEEAEKLYRKQLEDERIGWKMNGWRWLEILYRTLGQYDKAKNEAEAGLKYAEENNSSGWKRTFTLALTVHDLETGDLDSAFERAESYLESGLQDDLPGSIINANWLKTEVHLRRNDVENAVPLAEAVKTYVDGTPYIKDVLWYYMNLSLIEIKRQNYSQAIDLITQAYEMLGGQRSWIEVHAWILFNLASAYELSGDIEAAKKEYENILALTTGRLWWGDLYVKSYYQLGKIHEEQGNTTKAIEYYDKFLTLWKDADPGLSEVDDAKERLAGLRDY